MPEVFVSAEAAQELAEAAAWYNEQSPGLGAKLISAFENAISLLESKAPPLTPMSGCSGTTGREAPFPAPVPFLYRYDRKQRRADCHRACPPCPSAGLLERPNIRIEREVGYDENKGNRCPVARAYA